MKLKFLIAVSLTVFFFSCNEKAVEKIEKVDNLFFCDVEHVNDSLKLIYDTKDSSVTFNGYKLKTNEFAFSGSNSLKMSKAKPFAYGTDFAVSDTGQHYRVTALIKGNASRIRVVTKGKEKFYAQSEEVVETKENGWKLMVLNFKIPSSFNKGDMLKAYVWNAGSDTVFVDDFSINLITYEEKK